MDWLLEYMDLVVPVALVLLFLLQRVFGTDEEQRGPGPGSPDLDEEARRVQEEIRRKIVARQQGRTELEEEPAFEEPPPLVLPDADAPWERPAPPFVPQAEVFEPPPPAPAPQRDLFEELRREQARVREAQKQKEDALRRNQERAVRKKPVSVKRRREREGSLRREILRDLSTGQSLQRAFVLKEIVDRPVAIRPRAD